MGQGSTLEAERPAAVGASIAGRAMRAFRRHGPIGFAGLCAYNARLLATGRFSEHRYVYDDAFDRAHGVDTLGHVEVDEMVAPEHLKAGAAAYEATSPDCFQFLLYRAEIASPSDFTFVDIGSGKGRVLILAGLTGFRRVIGIEFGRDLHQTALANIDRLRQAGTPLPASCLNEDAGAFAFPPEPTVCYLNNPFGAATMRRLLDNIEASLAEHPREFRLIYLHANHADLFGASEWTEIDRGFYRNRRHPYGIWRWRR